MYANHSRPRSDCFSLLIGEIPAIGYGRRVASTRMRNSAMTFWHIAVQLSLSVRTRLLTEGTAIQLEERKTVVPGLKPQAETVSLRPALLRK